MNYQEQLIRKFEAKSAVVGIVGLGYVGLPLSLTFAKNNVKVIGFDIDCDKVKSLNNGISYIKHIDNRGLKDFVDRGNFYATSNMSKAAEVDALIICVPTPLGKHRDPDLSFIHNTVQALLPYLKKGQLISLESTTYPGTTEDHLLTKLVERNFTVGEDFFLVYSPEREDPGNPSFSTSTIPKVIGGITDVCAKVGIAMYEIAIKQMVLVSNTRVAEMTKLLENIHRAVNIGLMNELKLLSDKMDIDLYEVIEAASSKPFGFVPYYPGPGLGGHCIPIDPFYLTWKAREYGMHTRFIELAGEINTSMPNYVVNKTSEALNKIGKPLRDSKILILGIAYKKNIDDARESPSAELISLLNIHGANVDYSDPYFPIFPKMRDYLIHAFSIEICEKTLKSYDAIIISTDHDNFDYQLIKRSCELIIDTRGRFSTADNIVRA